MIRFDIGMSRYDPTDFEWRAIEPLLLMEPRVVPRVDDRCVRPPRDPLMTTSASPRPGRVLDPAKRTAILEGARADTPRGRTIARRVRQPRGAGGS